MSDFWTHAGVDWKVEGKVNKQWAVATAMASTHVLGPGTNSHRNRDARRRVELIRDGLSKISIHSAREVKLIQKVLKDHEKLLTG